MRIFGPNSTRRRRGETSALDEFTYHVPEHCDVRHARLEVDCFKKKAAMKQNENINFITQRMTSIENLKYAYEASLYESSADVEQGQVTDIANGNLQKEKVGLCNNRQCFPNYQTQSQINFSCNENAPEKCKTILNTHSTKCSAIKVILYPEEEWAKNAKTVQWTIKLNRWWKRFCTITEYIGGSRSSSAVGKISQNRDGTLTITGRFKRSENPVVKLHLTARVTKDDIQNGYLMTGALQQGNTNADGSMEITHFAVIPKYAR